MPTNYQLLNTIHLNQTQIIIPLLQQLVTQGTSTMAEIDDLNAAVSAMQTSVANAVSELNTLMADLSNALAANNAPAIGAAAQAIQAQVTALNNAVTTDAPPPSAAPAAPAPGNPLP